MIATRAPTDLPAPGVVRPPVGRLSAALRGLVGALVLPVGLGLSPHVWKEGLSWRALAAVVLVVVGLALLVSGTARASRGHGRLIGVGAGAAALVAAGLGAFLIGIPVAATNVPRPAIGATPSSVGLPYLSVSVTAPDGAELAAWYVPSRNGAAVVLMHGAGSTRSSVLAHARVLADHRFGVLLLDARGHGESGGRAMDFGWYGDLDVQAATSYLAGRPEVRPDRIGVVGMSMGGEEAIGAAAGDPRVRAVVAEGATARTAADSAWLSDVFGWRGAAQEQLERVQDWVVDRLTSARPPVALADAVASSDARFLLIAGEEVADEGHAARHMAAATPDRVEVWVVPGAGHTAGLRVAPDEWERRVVGFLTDALGLASGR